MAKAKAKTVTVRVSVLYDRKGLYVAGGRRTPASGRLSEASLIQDAKDTGYTTDDLPHVAVVDIELPIPEPLVGKVRRVKEVKT